jgi:VanZ family protein
VKKTIKKFWVILLADWLPLVNWLAIIFFLSSISGEKLPNLHRFSLDKIAHFTEYLILGYLMVRAFIDSFPNMNLTKALVLSIILCALYGMSDEWHQRFVSGRNCDFFDWIFDFLGSTSGILAFTYMKENKEHAKYKTF